MSAAARPSEVLAASPPGGADLGELSEATGLDLSAYKEAHVAERLRRAVEREGVGSAPALVRLLRDDPAARARFRRSVAVSVSQLFRDRAQFELLEREVLPALLEGGRRIRVWSAGCGNGSELYSVALLLERMGGLDRSLLLGSDLHEEAVAAARAGVYGPVSMPERLRRRTHWERRDLLTQGAPNGKWRLVLCRNVAIYLRRPVVRRLHEMLAGCLTAGGFLVLGRSEWLPDSARLGLERVARHTYMRTP